MTHKKKAEKLSYQKYHCSQALFGVFVSDFGSGMHQGGVCSCIMGFSDGRVAEQGTLEELMNTGTIYPHMVKLQMISQDCGI